MLWEQNLLSSTRTTTSSGKKSAKGKYNYFDQWFLLKVDLDIPAFRIQGEEVAAIKWFSPQELKEQLDKTPEQFLKGMPQCVEMFIDSNPLN